MTEEILKISGGRPLHGEISVQGAKNSALPLMAAALLCDGETVAVKAYRIQGSQYEEAEQLSFLSENTSVKMPGVLFTHEDNVTAILAMTFVEGQNVLILKQNDVQLILNQLMGLPLEVTDDFEFDEEKDELC